MTIATQIAALQQDKTDIANAITAKGGTVNSGDGFDDFASDIATIPSGGVGIPREVSAQGVYQMPSTNFSFSLPSEVKDVGQNALQTAFIGCTSLTSVDLSSLEDATGQNAFANAFRGCNSLTSVDLSSLERISGSTPFNNAFYNSSIKNINFSVLTELSVSVVLYNIFASCSSIETVSFPLLDNLTGNSVMMYAFTGASSLKNIYFNSLKTTSFGSNTNQFASMFDGTTGSVSGGCTIHFPSNLQTTISGLTGYPRFGGNANYITLAFDLPATS